MEDLKKVIEQNRETLTAWVDFKGIDLLLEYSNKASMGSLLEKCKTVEYRKHQPVEELSDKKFQIQLARLIKDWKITIGQLAALIDFDLAGQDPTYAVPCTDNNKVTLVKELYGLDIFIRDTVTDLEIFRAQKVEGLAKN